MEVRKEVIHTYRWLMHACLDADDHQTVAVLVGNGSKSKAWWACAVQLKGVNGHADMDQGVRQTVQDRSTN